MLQTHAQIILG